MKQLMLPVEVKKSNAIVRCKWTPAPTSPWEGRIVALTAAKITPKDKDFQTYEIPLSAVFGESTDLIGGDHYKRLRVAARRLLGTVIEIESEESGWTGYSLFSKCHIPQKRAKGGPDGNLLVRFDPDLRPHFLQLAGRFTQYNLLEFMQLTGTYAQRIFEILRSWDDKPEVTLDLADLQERMGVAESLRKRWPDFRRYVLEKAHREITRKTSFDFEWEAVKRGRAVTSIRFIFVKKRIEPVAKVKKAASDQKQMQDRNSAAKKAITCHAKWVKSGGSCAENMGHLICSACKQLYG